MVGSTPVSIQCLETISEIYFDLYWLWSMEESYKTPANEWATCLATGLINWRMKVLCGWLSQNQGCKPMRLRSLSIFHASYSSCSHWRKPTSIVCVQGRKRRWFDFFLESRSSHRLAFYSLRTIFDPWALQRSWFNSIHFEASSSKVKIDKWVLDQMWDRRSICWSISGQKLRLTLTAWASHVYFTSDLRTVKDRSECTDIWGLSVVTEMGPFVDCTSNQVQREPSLWLCAIPWRYS